MLKDIIEAERDQNADCARIGAAIHLAEQDIAALENRQLDSDEARKRWCAIRDRTLLAIRDVRRNVIKRAEKAKETETWMIEKFFREKATGNSLNEFAVTLQDISTKELLDYLGYLIRVGDPPRVQCIRVVFKSRVDHHRYNVTFDRMLAGFALEESGDIGKRLARICRSAEKADARVVDLFAAYGSDNQLHAPTAQQQARTENLVDEIGLVKASLARVPSDLPILEDRGCSPTVVPRAA
jgi:hypothetical protein